MMKNLQSSAQVAKTTQLLSSVARLRLLLVMFLTLTVSAEVWAEEGTINFNNNAVKINAASVTGDDDLGNSWTITTVGTTSFTQQPTYSQVGSSSKPATSITFTTTLPQQVTITNFEAKFGGFNSTAGNVTLKVGDTSVGTGKLNATSDVTIQNTEEATGKILTVTVTDISKGVKAYYISYTYTTSGGDPDPVDPEVTFSNGEYTIGGAALDLSTLWESNSTGAVTYSVTNAGTTGATVNGTSFTATAAGTCTVQASQAATATHNAATATATITVTAPAGGGSGEGECSWTLVTDASTLKADDEVIITASGENDYALSTNQKSSNRGATAITKNGNTLTSPSADVQILALKAGSTPGTWAFYTGTSGYLYAASSSGNQLKTKTTLDEHGSWTISITDGVASIVAEGSSNRNVMQYNYNNGSPLFACYSSASQTSLEIYKKVCTGGATEPSPTLTANPTSLSFGTVNQNATVAAQTFTLTGSNLESGNLTISAPEGYSVSSTSVPVAADGTVSATIPVTPTTANAGTFNGNITISGGGLEEDVTVSLSMTVKAVYTITWNNSGTETTSEYVAGSTLKFPTEPTCEGKTFVGWTTEENYSDATTPPPFIDDNTQPKGNTTYYAVFADKSGFDGDIDFRSQGWTGTQYLTEDEFPDGITIGDVHLTFEHISGSNNEPRYATDNGTKLPDVRLFYNNRLTISVQNQNITQINFTFNTSNTSDNKNTISANVGNWVSPTWTGKSSSVTFTTSGESGHHKITAIEVITDGDGVTYFNYTTSCTTTYTVTYNGNGNTGGTVPTDGNEYSTDDKVTVKGDTGNLTRTGYTFLGWQIDKTGTTYQAGDQFTITKNTTLYAQWEAITYTVAFDANDGTGTMDNQSFNYDETKTLTANTFSRIGYTFTGWNTKSDGTGTSYNNQQSVKNLTTTDGATVTLYAQWKIQTFTVTFDKNGGTGTMANQTFTYNVSQNLTANTFTRTGYTFTGWNTAADGSGTTYADKQSVTLTTAGITLYAQWTAITYTVAFNANGGTGTMDNQSFSYDETKTLTANTFSRTGYTFTGWNTAADGSGTTYTDQQSVKNLTTTDGATVTLYAQWKKTHTITWMVGGTSVHTETVVEGKPITETPSDDIAGDAIGDCADTFMGWSEKSSGSTPEDATYYFDLCTAAQMKAKYTSVDANKTFYAVFAKAGALEIETVTTTQSSFTSTSGNLNSDTNISYSSKKGESSTPPGNYNNSIRLYQASSDTKTGGYIIISAKTGCTITSASITSSSQYSTTTTGYLLSAPASTPKKSDFVVNDYSLAKNSTYTVSDIETSAITFACFNTNSSNRLEIASISVTYTKQGAPSYSDYVTSCCETQAPTNGAHENITGSGNAMAVTLTWEDSNNYGRYHITSTNPAIDEIVTDETFYTVSGLTECETYTFNVSAYPEYGCESAAINIQVTPYIPKTITFRDGSTQTTESTTCDDDEIEVPTPTAQNCSTYVWKDEQGNVYAAGDKITPTTNMTLTTVWTVISYTVTFVDYDGTTVLKESDVNCGEMPTPPTDPTRPENNTHKYTFAGWTPTIVPANSDATYTATYTETQHQITVIWMVNGEVYTEGGPSTTVSAGEKVAKLPTPPSPDDYCGQVFAGWTGEPIDEVNDNIPSILFTTPDASPTIYKEDDNATITFYAVFANIVE